MSMQVDYYAEMTWPEIAALPRDAQLVIPLGLAAYDLEQAGRKLKADHLVVLPPLPYGFPMPGDGLLAGLAVGRALLRRVLLGIQRELSRQGFRRIAWLDGHKVRQHLGSDAFQWIELAGSGPLESSGASFPTLPKAELARRIMIVSVGHTEQHGYHLPLSTDSVIVQAIADGMQRALPEQSVCLPAWPYGVSTHTRQFPGTLSLGGRCFEDFFQAIVGRLVQMGAEMVFFSNGHGGNHSFLVNVVKYAGEQWPTALTATEFMYATGEALARYRTTKRGGMGHGGELETSLMLYLEPQRVQMDKARPEVDFISTANYWMDWVEGGRLIANPPWTDDTVTGLYGDPRPATAEKGRLWLEAALAEKAELLDELRQQHDLRKARRLERAFV
jgi:creatinine amidohydrolase